MTEADKKSSTMAPPVTLTRTGGRSLVGLALIMMFVAAIFANSTFGELKKASSFETWSRAQATVVDCINQREGVFSSAVGRDRQMVTCQFSTAGRIVRSHFPSEGWKYHKGQTIVMRFDPFAPERSMVDPSSAGPVALWGSIAFAVFFIAGTVLLIYALKRLKAQVG